MLNGGSNWKVFVSVVYFLILYLDKSAGGNLIQISVHNTDFILQRAKGWVNIAINSQTYVSIKTQLVFSPQGQRKWTCAKSISSCVLWLTRPTNLTGKRREENKINYAKKSYRVLSTHSCCIAGKLY